jgi:nitrate reductase NapE component
MTVLFFKSCAATSSPFITSLLALVIVLHPALTVGFFSAYTSWIEFCH